MLLLLTIAAAAVALLLFTSALSVAKDPLGLDPTTPGRWGLLDRERIRQRSLSAHERRWQTQVLRSEGDEATWRGLLDSLEELEATLGGPGTAPATRPADFDRRYLRDTIARLDRLAEAKGSSAPTTVADPTNPNGARSPRRDTPPLPGGTSE